MRPHLPLLLALVLSGCQSAPAPKPGPAPAPSARTAAIHGRAFHLERMAPIPGAMLEVHLFDERGETIASSTFGDLHGPPYEFDLPYDAARVDATHRYALRAALRDARGRLEFATGTRVPVVPGSTERVELRLLRSALPRAPR